MVISLMGLNSTENRAFENLSGHFLASHSPVKEYKVMIACSNTSKSHLPA